jgi:pilus assembly protein CpaB
MSFARILILSVAVVAAGVAAFLVNTLISANDVPAIASQSPTISPTGQVLVANERLNVGQVIGSGDLRWQVWPEEAVTAAYISKARDAKAKQKSVGATVRQAMLAGEPVTKSKIIRPEGAGFMAALLDPGMRAVSVKISPETGAGGFILPNDRVDLIMTRRSNNDGGGQGGFQSETILSKVRVLAIDQSFQEEGDTRVAVGKIATLELLPEQAEVLALAEAMGDISLALRSLADHDAADVADSNASQRGAQSAVTLLRYGASSRVPVRSAGQ